jgi:DNA-3-methyladenine glycosylase II
LSAIKKITLEAVPPFSFDLSVEIFSNGDRQIRKYDQNKFWQIIRVNGKLILVTVESAGAVDKPKLSAELKSDKTLSHDDAKRAEEALSVLFSLNFDLVPFYEETKTDKTMTNITQRLWGLKSPTTPTAFEALIDSIVEQQISLKVANSIENKLTKRFGDALSIDDEVYYAYPTPRKLASVGIEEIRQCGLSQRKAEYIQGISKLVANGELNLEKLKNCESADEIISELDRVRGVGVWTAELTMLRGMQKLEALPADDLGLRRTIARYYCGGKVITSAQARQIAENWGRWKGLAAYYLVVAEMRDIEV